MRAVVVVPIVERNLFERHKEKKERFSSSYLDGSWSLRYARIK